jgi:uncharacterized protein (DUF1330 family)
MPAYIVAQVALTDTAWLQSEYLPVLQRLLQQYSGKPIASGRHQHLEGDVFGTLTVIDEFPDLASAQAFWNDPEYQRVVPLRQAGSDSRVVLIDGTTPS